MNPFPTSTLRAGAILGFFTMAVIGWKLANEPERPPISQPEIATHSADRPTRANRRGGPPDAVRQRMAELHAITSPDERLRATMALANSIPVSEIPAWLDGRWFNVGEGFDLILFNKLLKERWQLEDSEGLLAWSFKNNPSQARETLNAWAKTDPQRALAYLKDHPNRDVQMQVLTEIAKSNPALALQALAEHSAAGRAGSGLGDYYLRELLEQMAKSSPAVLEAALASLPPKLRKEVDIVLIKDRMTTSFATEIRKLWERPDGWKIFLSFDSDGRGTLTGRLFEELANLPPAWRAALVENPYSVMNGTDAEKWCSADLVGFGFTTTQANAIHRTALSQLASRAPETALKLMADMDLDASIKQGLIASLFRNFRGSPDQAEALLAMLGSEEERKWAREAPATYDKVFGKPVPKIEQPADWLAQVGAADPKSVGSDSYRYLSMLSEWDAEKITALGSQFQTLPDDQKLQVAQMLNLNSGYADNITSLQGDALRYLIANPSAPAEGDQNSANPTISQASQFAVDWADKDPAAASDWVQSLPAGDAKLWAQKNLAANWAQVDPEATDRWLSTLPAADRTQVREFMSKSK